MKKLISSRILRKIAVTYLMATVLLINFPFQAYADLVTVTVQANGQNALTLATSTDSFDITLTTTNAVSCTMTSPSIGGGIAINASMHISPGDTTYYPSIGGSVTFAVTCDDGHGVIGSGSVVVSLPAPVPAPTVNITANGVHGSTTITSPNSYTYAWTSNNATLCKLSSPSTGGGVSEVGSSTVTSADTEGYYPGVGAPVTITINCTNDNYITTVSDSVVINLSGGGGGGTTYTVTPVVTNGSSSPSAPQTVNSGNTVSFAFTPNAGYVLDSVSVNSATPGCGSGSNVYNPVTTVTTVTTGAITSNCTITAVYSLSATPAPTVNITANGVHGSTTITSPNSYTYTWASTNATSCNLSSPTTGGGVSEVGSATVISTDAEGYYPTVGRPVTITINCTDGTTTVSDSVIINLQSGGGGSCTLPTITSALTASGTVNTAFSYTTTTTSTSTPTYSIGASVLPTGLSFAPSTGIISGTPTQSGTFNISITTINPCGTDIQTLVLTIGGGTVTTNLVANPITLFANATSTLTWSSTNATSCSAPWTASTDTSGSQIVTVATTTTYSITCTNGVTPVTASATVTVIVPGICALPTINSTLTASGTVGTAFSYTATTLSTSTPTLSIGTSVLPAGLSFSTTTGIISGTPTQTETQNIIITATNPCGVDTQTLVLTINPAAIIGGGGGGSSSGGGGGGGSISGGSRHPIYTTTTTTTSNGLECLYLKDYMRRDFNNDPIEVMKLQAFLKTFEGYDYVTVNGVFDQATFDAVSAFQMKYEADVLTPWGHTAPTGYVYITTLKKINEIYCQKVFPLSAQQQLEINAHRALLEHLRSQGIQVGNTEVGLNSTSTPEIPIVGIATPPKGQNFSNVGAAFLAFPTTLPGFMQCLYEWLLILIVLYILGSVLKDVLYEDVPKNVLKKFITKWITMVIGIAIAIWIAYVTHEWCLILPLVIALIIVIIWMLLLPIHDDIRVHIKSWYIVISARTKSMWKNFVAKF